MEDGLPGSRKREKMKEIQIGKRKIGPHHPPLVIAEVGINHEGDVNKAIRMIDDAANAGCECVKFQSHIPEEEMIPNDVRPGHTKETIWEIMERCLLTEEEELRLKEYTESKGMIYLCTPFSRAAADRLNKWGVAAYKIGSGECNNYPLIEHVTSFGKPIILSTGMNDIESIGPSVQIMRKATIPFALLHCTSLYPTPYNKVRLGAITHLERDFPDAVIGLSDHSIGIYTCLGAVALGASILEKHFTSDKKWEGPDIAVSMDPAELKELIIGSRAIFEAKGGQKTILPEEKPTIDFAYASVVTIRPVKKGGVFSKENIWVKRPGTGALLARDFKKVLGKRARVDLALNHQLEPSEIEGWTS